MTDAELRTLAEAAKTAEVRKGLPARLELHADRVLQLLNEKRDLEVALTAMVRVDSDGQPCYVTDSGVPQQMPPKIRRLVAAALPAFSKKAING